MNKTAYQHIPRPAPSQCLTLYSQLVLGFAGVTTPFGTAICQGASTMFMPPLLILHLSNRLEKTIQGRAGHTHQGMCALSFVYLELHVWGNARNVYLHIHISCVRREQDWLPKWGPLQVRRFHVEKRVHAWGFMLRGHHREILNNFILLLWIGVFK